MSKQDLILLYGGRSAEREVSVLSAESVMRAIDYQAFSVQTYCLIGHQFLIIRWFLFKSLRLDEIS